MNRKELAAKVAKELSTLDELCELLGTAHPGYLKKQVQNLKTDNEQQAAALADLVELTGADNYGNALKVVAAALTTPAEPVEEPEPVLFLVELLANNHEVRENTPALVKDLCSEPLLQDTTVSSWLWSEAQVETALTPGRASSALVSVAVDELCERYWGPSLGGFVNAAVKGKYWDQRTKCWKTNFLSQTLVAVLAEAEALSKELA